MISNIQLFMPYICVFIFFVFPGVILYTTKKALVE